MAIWKSSHRLIVALSALVGLCFPACVDAQTGASMRAENGTTMPATVFTPEPPMQPPSVLGDSDAIASERQSQALGLPELLHIALERNPELRQARFQVGAAQGRALQAGLYP